MTLTIVEEARAITGGVDTHADTHMAAALDRVGGLLGGQLTQNAKSGRRQPLTLSGNIPRLEPDHHQLLGRAGRTPGEFQQPLTEKEHHPWIGRRPGLAADRQAEHIPVEMAAAAIGCGARIWPRAGRQKACPMGRRVRANRRSRRSRNSGVTLGLQVAQSGL
jgi:hypothetical protein